MVEIVDLVNAVILEGGFSLLVAMFMITIATIWAILPIILFFKVWGMTNDIREMRDLYRDQMDLEHPLVEIGSNAGNGSHVDNYGSEGK